MCNVDGTLLTERHFCFLLNSKLSHFSGTFSSKFSTYMCRYITKNLFQYKGFWPFFFKYNTPFLNE